jgi:large conductance mechanosensitive channel
MWLDDPVFNGIRDFPDLREFPGYRGLSGFKKFLLRGNVVDLAVAVVIGTAFTAVVTSFSESFLTPLIALLSGGGELGGSFWIGEQEFTWGAFLSKVITFVLTAAIVYFVVVLPVHKVLERMKDEPVVPAAAPTQVELLIEIRDLLRAQQPVAPADSSVGRHAPPGTA